MSCQTSLVGAFCALGISTKANVAQCKFCNFVAELTHFLDSHSAIQGLLQHRDEYESYEERCCYPQYSSWKVELLYFIPGRAFQLALPKKRK
jgi:hypothetical protein